MALVREMLVLSLPHTDSLTQMLGRHGEVELAAKEIAPGWCNAYSTECVGFSLVQLLCDLPGSSFTRKYWEQHIKKGTPLTIKKHRVPEPVPNDAMCDLLKHTCAVVLKVLEGLQITDPRITMQTKLPVGTYCYHLAFRGKEVEKVGKFQCDGVGRACIWDRFKKHLTSLSIPNEWGDAPFPPPLDEIEVVGVVPAPHGEFNERYLQCKLRLYAGKVPGMYHPCLNLKTKTGKPGTTEFVDARLRELTSRYMTRLGRHPDKCVKKVDVDVSSSSDESDGPKPRGVATVASEPPVAAAPVDLPLAEPVLASAPEHVLLTAPGAANFKKELKEAKALNAVKGKDPNRFLTDAQILRKVARLRQYFEDGWVLGFIKSDELHQI